MNVRKNIARNISGLNVTITDTLLIKFSKLIGIPATTVVKYMDGSSNNYTITKIPKKSGGFRVIEAPCDELKEIQSRILHRLLRNERVSKAAHGFCEKRSTKTCAEVHLGAKALLKMDISNFFPSISIAMAFSAIRSTHAPIISVLCTMDGRLPQGAPTSPYLSNLYLKPIDSCLNKYCNERGWRYSRYADDYIISSERREKVTSAISLIKTLTREVGLKINDKKTFVGHEGQKLKVTGWIVNESDKVRIDRKERMKNRAALHHIELGLREMDRKLKGRLAWQNM